MSIERAIRKNVLAYLKSLDVPDNEVYQQHGFLIDSCFVKALEIVEKTIEESTVFVNFEYDIKQNGDK